MEVESVAEAPTRKDSYCRGANHPRQRQLCFNYAKLFWRILSIVSGKIYAFILLGINNVKRKKSDGGENFARRRFFCRAKFKLVARSNQTETLFYENRYASD